MNGSDDKKKAVNRERLQLPEKYKQNFDVSSEGPSLGSWWRLTSRRDEGPHYFCVFTVSLYFWKMYGIEIEIVQQTMKS